MSIFYLGGVPIYYERFGKGPELVFLHGYTCNLEHWRWIAEVLAKEYQVTLYDMRCHGKSDKDADHLVMKALTEEARALIEGLGIRNPVLIGHSMGGMMALEYSLFYPQEVKAFVLAEAHTHIDTTARLVGSGVLDERTDPVVARRIDTDMGNGSQYVTEDLFNSLLVFDVRQQVASLKMPILFLWGDRYGDMTPRKLAEFVQESGFHEMPNLTVQPIYNSHHFIMLEQPEATLLTIQAFLKRL